MSKKNVDIASSEWLGQAVEDLTAAEHMVKAGDFAFACFASALAAEKAIKGPTGWRRFAHGRAEGGAPGSKSEFPDSVNCCRVVSKNRPLKRQRPTTFEGW